MFLQSVSVSQRCRHTSRTQLLLGPQLLLLLLLPAPQLMGVRTQPCWGSGEPLRGIPENPWGQLHVGWLFTVSHRAFGPQLPAASHAS